jgi:hypothetical protein
MLCLGPVVRMADKAAQAHPGTHAHKHPVQRSEQSITGEVDVVMPRATLRPTLSARGFVRGSPGVRSAARCDLDTSTPPQPAVSPHRPFRRGAGSAGGRRRHQQVFLHRGQDYARPMSRGSRPRPADTIRRGGVRGGSRSRSSLGDGGVFTVQPRRRYLPRPAGSAT